VSIMAINTKITKRVVDGLAPHPSGVARVMAWDSELRGFGVRVHPTGRRIYIIKYRRAGRDQTFTIGEHGAKFTAEQARIRAREVLNAVASGDDPNAAKREIREAITVNDLIEAWLRDGPTARPNKREWSWRTDKSRLTRHAAPTIGRLLVREVTRRDVERMQARITNGDTAIDVRTGKRGRAIASGGRLVAGNTVVCVSAMFGWAVEQGLADANPCIGVKKAKAEPRTRYLTRKETGDLLTTLEDMERERSLLPAHADAIRLLLLTGARKSEILGLRWSEIDLERQWVKLPATRSKTGAREPIRLAEAAIAILQRQPRSTDFVFPAQSSAGHMVGLPRAWTRVRTRAGLDNVRLHDLRHNVASVAVSQGTSLYLTGKILGHRNAATTQRYAHVADDPLQKVAELVAQEILNARKE
jgi:integrase